MNGTAGDLRPRDAIGATADERVSRFGGALAEAATGLMNQTTLSSKGDLAAWGWRVSLPLPQLYLGPVPIHPQIGRWMRPTSAYLNLMGLDDAVFVPLAAEMTAGLGTRLKQTFTAQGMKPFLLGYASGYLGYAVTPQEYATRSYEAWMTWYGSGFGLSLIAQIERLARLYPEKRKPSALHAE
ncbi:MAG: hypothetical protein HYZ93_06850 [Candidatus Omnitrophica bacterium]|nr:hypothetical protein [Candidatus Omnitrophota bacterium]